MTCELHLHIDIRDAFAGGASFGDTGSYERIAGRAEVFLDPESPAYSNVVDIQFAPRDAEGRVRYETDFYLLKPADMTRGNRRLFYDVVNRGDKRALQFFNDAPAGNAPSIEADAGNGFLLRQGYTVLWCGWQADLLPGEGRATLTVPVAQDGSQDITGTVREELIAEADGVVTMPLSGKSQTRSHPAVSLDTAEATLTRRRDENDARETIPASDWMFARIGEDGAPEASPTDIYLPAGFRRGWIYEAIYTAKAPQVLGLGFAAVRDLVDMLRHDTTDAGGRASPLAPDGQPTIVRAYAWGRSQSGRYLREFVYRGWNEGRSGQRIFDAIWPHVTGAGRLALNLRFGHPDRYPRQHEQHLYPSDQFPFAYVETTDQWSGRTDAVLRRPPTDPLVLHTQTASEYWQRRGSLVHTDTKGNDLAEHPRVRMYHFAGSQHHAAPGIPAQQGPHRNLSNPLSTSPLLRALLVRLDAWSTAGELPPPSAVPRRADGTLVGVGEIHARFPNIGGARPPGSPNRLFALDFGPAYDNGIATIEPPNVDISAEYPVYLPAVDADGNEVSGLRTPDIEVPRATYAGWNLRTEPHGSEAMYSIVGSYLPFPESPAERATTDDPRPSIEERYSSGDTYAQRVEMAARALAARGLLLSEDVDRYIAAARQAGQQDT